MKPSIFENFKSTSFGTRLSLAALSLTFTACAYNFENISNKFDSFLGKEPAPPPEPVACAVEETGFEVLPRVHRHEVIDIEHEGSRLTFSTMDPEAYVAMLRDISQTKRYMLDYAEQTQGTKNPIKMERVHDLVIAGTYFGQMITGIPHELSTKTIHRESSFNPEAVPSGNSGGRGYGQCVRNSFLDDNIILHTGEDEVRDKLVELDIIPDKIAIGYSMYWSTSFNRMSALSAKNLATLTPYEQKRVLGLEHNFDHRWDRWSKIKHTRRVNKAEDLKFTDAIHQVTCKDPVAAPILMAYRTRNNIEKMWEAKLIPTEQLCHISHTKGIGAGINQGKMLLTMPNEPIWRSFGNNYNAVMAKHGDAMRLPENYKYYYDDTGKFRTIISSAQVSAEKGFSADPLELIDTDNYFTRGLLDGSIKITYTPADTTFVHKNRRYNANLQDLFEEAKYNHTHINAMRNGHKPDTLDEQVAENPKPLPPVELPSDKSAAPEPI